jgi:hypothetical protein
MATKGIVFFGMKIEFSKTARRHLIGKTESNDALIAKVIAIKRQMMEDAGYYVEGNPS